MNRLVLSASNLTTYYGVIGLLILCLILIFIVFCMFKINRLETYLIKKDSSVESTSKTPILSQVPVILQEDSSIQEEEEVVAAIMACIAASLNTTSDKLNVRSIRRVRNQQHLIRR